MKQRNVQIILEFINDAAYEGLRYLDVDRNEEVDVTAAREAFRLIRALCREYLAGDVD
jgi:hypothetical protein